MNFPSSQNLLVEETFFFKADTNQINKENKIYNVWTAKINFVGLLSPGLETPAHINKNNDYDNLFHIDPLVTKCKCVCVCVLNEKYYGVLDMNFEFSLQFHNYKHK